MALTAAPATAQQPSDEDLKIAPAPGSSTDPAGTYFVIDSRPGRTVRQRLQITNAYNRRVQIEVSPVDAATASTGGVAFELATEAVDDEGSWLDIERGRLSLPAGKSGEVAFRVEIPTDTEPGVHLAGLAVQLVDEAEAGPSPTSGGAVVDVQSRFVVAVQVNLPGNSTPEIVILGVEPVVGTAGISLQVLIENVGFGLTKGEGVLELPDEGFEEALPLATFVPGTSIRYPVTWIEDPAEGEYAARVELNYSEGDPELLTGRASWEGTFTIGEGQTQEIDRLQGGGGFNWLLAIIPGLLLLLLLVAFFVWRRRRTAGPPSAKPPPSAHPAASAQQGYTGGYSGSAGGTFGGPSQSGTPPPQQRAPGTAPPPPPPPPRQAP